MNIESMRQSGLRALAFDCGKRVRRVLFVISRFLCRHFSLWQESVLTLLA
ncbi:hypothetical protein [Candidatus Burkholderia verschuerenii]